MDAFAATVNDVKASINDFLNARGGEVSDLALSLINRARAYVWQYKPWSYLRATATLTLDANQECDLPHMFGRVHRITANSTTLFPVYGFEHTDVTLRYTFVNTVDNNLGLYRKFKFHNSQTSLYLVYIFRIENVSELTDYLLFPANLIIRAAELIRARDKNRKHAEIVDLKDAFDEEIKDFQQYYHSDNAQMSQPQRDYYGTLVSNDSIDMLGD